MDVVVQTATRTGLRISHYEIGDLVGAGGMGEVYRATDLRLGRRVALKFLRPFADLAMRQRLTREARAASLLDHPNICTIFEVDETPDGDVFVAMAYYDGETLDRLLARGALDPTRALAIAVQAGRALAAAHDELVVHCDVKPANIFITRGDTVKILDFGISRLLHEAGSSDDGQSYGTPAYMAPEQATREPVDQRTDVWGLGVVLYQMLSGLSPFEAGGMASTLDAVLNRTPPPLSSRCPALPPQIDRIVDKALAKNPRFRYERADALVQDLVALQTALDTNALTVRVTAGASRSSVAVLPFADMSPGRDQEYLCDGIAEEVLRALGRIPDLYVASRTSAFQFKARAADVREIGARLNVSSILEGSVRRAGDRVRITVQLVNVEDGYRLWCERYERDIRDIFAVEDEIAERIAQALEVRLARRTPAGARRAFEPDAEAYELYLQGRQFFHQHRRKALEIALQTFSRAIGICPGYARAYAGIADCHSFLNLYFGSGAPAIDAADTASARALHLEPELADAHASRGLALFLRRDFERARNHLRRAIELDPRLYEPHYIFGRVSFSQGQALEAAEHFRDACSLVPEAYDSWYLLGMCYRRLGDAMRARHANFECIEAVQRWVKVHPDDTRAWTMGAAVLADMGEPDRASEWVGRATTIDRDEAIIQYNAACVYLALGRRDDALAALEASARCGVIATDWMKNDPDMDAVRDDPRFVAILEGAPATA